MIDGAAFILASCRGKRGANEQNSKVYADAASALRGVVEAGMTLMCGGFGACGIPEN